MTIHTRTTIARVVSWAAAAFIGYGLGAYNGMVTAIVAWMIGAATVTEWPQTR